MNSFSLLTTPWLPVRYKDGTTGKLAPVDLADENVVDIAAPRADLQERHGSFAGATTNQLCAKRSSSLG